MARVTLCVPTIGRVKYLPETRRSLSEQTFKDLEILILDNASPHEGAGMIAEWAAADSRVQILRSDARLPMFENFNRGIHAAQGEYLAFCHDDDEYAPGFVSRSVAFLDAHPSVGLCGSNLVFIDKDGVVLERRGHARHDSVRSGTSFALRILATGRNTIVMPSIFYRKSAIPTEGLDTGLSMHFGDFVFLMRMAENGGIGIVGAELVRIRKHDDQASGGAPMSEQIPFRTQILSSYCDEFAHRYPDKDTLVAGMRAAGALGHRTSLLWGWMIAANDAEASSCVEGLKDGLVDRAIGTSLRTLANLGLRPRKAPKLLKVAKGIAARAGL